jgi:hypothetical protein
VDAATWAVISTTDQVLNIGDEDLFEAPSKVLQTAITPRDNGTRSIQFSWDRKPQPKDPTPEYIVIMHFAELQVLPNNAVREFYVSINGKLFYPIGVAPFHLSAGFIYNMDPLPGSAQYNVSINQLDAAAFHQRRRDILHRLSRRWHILRGRYAYRIYVHEN